MSEKKWYAVYTRFRSEKKVSDVLSKKGFETYCPLNRVRKQWSDRKKYVQEPLFTTYVFVKLSTGDHARLLKTDGVINLVYWLGKPAVIRDVEIDTIKEFLLKYSEVLLEKTPVSINDTVRIVSGALSEQEGHIISVHNKTVKVALPSLGYMMTAQVEIDKVELVNSARKYYIVEEGDIILK